VSPTRPSPFTKHHTTSASACGRPCAANSSPRCPPSPLGGERGTPKRLPTRPDFLNWQHVDIDSVHSEAGPRSFLACRLLETLSSVVVSRGNVRAPGLSCMCMYAYCICKTCVCYGGSRWAVKVSTRASRQTAERIRVRSEDVACSTRLGLLVR